MGFVGVAGRLPKAGFSGSRPWDSAVSGQSAVLPSTPQEAALRPRVLRGVARPDVLKGSGTRVGLPAAHYSDTQQSNKQSIYLFIVTFKNLEFWDVSNLPPLK